MKTVYNLLGIFFVVWFSFGNIFSSEAVPLVTSYCAKITPQDINLAGASMLLRNNGVIGNLAEEYISAEQSWNISTRVEISPNCTIRICSSPFLAGACVTSLVKNDLVTKSAGEWQSARCTCSDVIISTSKPSSSKPPLISIPANLDTIVKQLEEIKFHHVGLESAAMSLINGRSSRTAHILLMGTSGAGKSTLINNLFGARNLSAVGHTTSVTSVITEYKLPVKVDQFGVANGELILVDTPGLEDTRGVEYDATFLANLDEYLSSHEGLQGKLPNLILILHPFHDNRYDGGGSQFVKMLRKLDYFREKVTSSDFSNVLFVFSHLCSGSNSEPENPSKKLETFKKVIETYTLFPKPIQTLAIENHGEEQELPEIDGNYKLPNKDFFPANIIDKMERILDRSGDPMGKAIFTSAFRTSLWKTSPVQEMKIPAISSSHGKVSQYFRKISGYSQISTTLVSKLLEHSYQEMNSSMKTIYKEDFYYLLDHLWLRNIHQVSDLPVTTFETLKLFQEMDLTSGRIYLLETVLNMTQPLIPGRSVIGQGFDFQKNVVHSMSPFNLGNLTPSLIGFRIPSFFQAKGFSNTRVEYELIPISNWREYYQLVLVDAGYSWNVAKEAVDLKTIPIEAPPGIYFEDSSCSSGRCFLKASIFYKIFQIEISPEEIGKRENLQEGFVRRIEGLKGYNESDYENVKSWQEFFADYGTHIVGDAYGGGRIDIQVTCPRSSLDNVIDKIFKVVEFAENPKMIFKEGLHLNHILPPGVSHTLSFYGGDSSYHVSKLTVIELDEAVKYLKLWKNSLSFNPKIFPGGKIPISEVAKGISNQTAENILAAASLLIAGKLKFTPAHIIQQRKEEAELLEIYEESQRKIQLLEEKKAALQKKMDDEEKAFRRGLENSGKEQEIHRALEMAKVHRQMDTSRRSWVDGNQLNKEVAKKVADLKSQLVAIDFSQGGPQSEEDYDEYSDYSDD